MTQFKDLKVIVRARQEATGESYAEARRVVLERPRITGGLPERVVQFCCDSPVLDIANRCCGDPFDAEEVLALSCPHHLTAEDPGGETDWTRGHPLAPHRRCVVCGLAFCSFEPNWFLNARDLPTRAPCGKPSTGYSIALGLTQPTCQEHGDVYDLPPEFVTQLLQSFDGVDGREGLAIRETSPTIHQNSSAEIRDFATPPLRLLRIKATLDGIDPPIWREMLIRNDISLSELHTLLQAAMGWEDAHLHAFKIRGVKFVESEPEADEILSSQVTVGQAFGRARTGRYLYDFGDSWYHTLVLRKADAADSLPENATAIVLGGGRACPPEDVGGVDGYLRFLRVMSDPRHPDHDETFEWHGEEFDPDEPFDPWMANRALGIHDDDDAIQHHGVLPLDVFESTGTKFVTTAAIRQVVTIFGPEADDPRLVFLFTDADDFLPAEGRTVVGIEPGFRSNTQEGESTLTLRLLLEGDGDESMMFGLQVPNGWELREAVDGDDEVVFGGSSVSLQHLAQCLQITFLAVDSEFEEIEALARGLVGRHQVTVANSIRLANWWWDEVFRPTADVRE